MVPVNLTVDPAVLVGAVNVSLPFNCNNPLLVKLVPVVTVNGFPFILNAPPVITAVLAAFIVSVVPSDAIPPVLFTSKLKSK